MCFDQEFTISSRILYNVDPISQSEKKLLTDLDPKTSALAKILVALAQSAYAFMVIIFLDGLTVVLEKWGLFARDICPVCENMVTQILLSAAVLIGMRIFYTLYFFIF